MFNKNKNQPTDKKMTTNSATLISAATVLHGDVNSDSDLRIDGTIQGNVTCKAKIVVGPTGLIEGNIDGKQADITGKVIGNISVEDTIQLRPQSYVQGNIVGATLQLDNGAVFNGFCQMGTGGNVVLMKEKELDVHAKAQ